RRVSDEKARATNPLVERVDALLRRHQEAAQARDELPVLTEIVDPDKPRAAAALDAAAVEALSRELERAVLQRLEDELKPTLAALGRALRVALREAVTGAVARELQLRKLDASALAQKRSGGSGD
ncbi:MAG: hypothetical protein OEW94_04780, partial [Betaproteobacteria bacterium]|nr:hypothetical protein [Betaproteobacteria bacterium]